MPPAPSVLLQRPTLHLVLRDRFQSTSAVLYSVRCHVTGTPRRHESPMVATTSAIGAAGGLRRTTWRLLGAAEPPKTPSTAQAASQNPRMGVKAENRSAQTRVSSVIGCQTDARSE